MKNKKSKANNGKKKVLSDHKRLGKKFLPPFNHMLGPMKNTSYIRTSLPELVWIDQLNWILGEQRTADISVQLSKILPKIKPDETVWWACDSHFKILNRNELKRLRNEIETTRIGDDLRRGLNDFLVCYPQSGLRFIFDSTPTSLKNPAFIDAFEARLDELLDKRSRPAVLMQAIPIYMGFVQDRLKVAKGLALADFPEVSHYPSTQRSKEVGASICASINMLIGQQITDRSLDAWSIEFWNRGLQIKPIDLSYLEHDDAST